CGFHPKILRPRERGAECRLNLWSAGLYLRREEAKALQREIWALYQGYALLSPLRKEEGQARYLLHLGLAPASD
ncbi:MAG: hypothetical protein N2324_13420, partial [Thermus sp.]|nr:hypothetical protein [Thermus sp.]